MTDAAHWETYALPGKPGEGEICLNGCPAHLFKAGDEVIILSLDQLSREEASRGEQKVVFVDRQNKVVRTLIKKTSENKLPA